MIQIQRNTLLQIFSYGYTALQRVFQSNTGRLGFALVILASATYWWRSRGVETLTGKATDINYGANPALEKQVEELEKAVKEFWEETECRITHPSRAVTSNVLEQKIKLDLEQLQNRVRSLNVVGAPDALEKRIHGLYESTMLSKKGVDSPTKTPPSSALEYDLLAKPWHQQLDAYDQCVSAYLAKQDSSLLSELEQFNDLYLQQVRELYRFDNKDEFLSCIVRIHTIKRRLLTPAAVIAPPVIQPAKTAFGGLERSGNNSCYLATALQLFRAIPSLRDRFDPSKNQLPAGQASKIQESIHAILEGMESGKTVPAQAGKDLQRLLKGVEILNRDIFGFYDAGEIAAQLLYLVGSELPQGLQSIKRVHATDSHELSEVFEDYRLAVVIPPQTFVNVGEEVQRLTTPREEIVQEEIGPIKHIYTVTSLPGFMVVEFLGPSPNLVNVVKFDDPLDSHHEYELVFGMQNTGAHWIAHILCEGNQWMTADDARISQTNTQNLSKINRGFYQRKAKS
jgi:hypothetical protein